MPANDGQRRPLMLSLVVTLTCIVLAGIHLVFPRLKIDLITLVLLLGAGIPWLAPVLKSIELPGGLKFELQEFKQEVRQEVAVARQEVEALGSRVDEVERVVFLGASPEQERTLSEAIAKFKLDLESRGLPITDRTALVKISPDSSESTYLSSGIILIGDKLARDVTVALHQYAHFVLQAVRGSSAKLHSAVRATYVADIRLATLEVDLVDAALADYFVASHRGDPVIGRIANLYLNEAEGTSSIRDLSNDFLLTDLDEAQGPLHVSAIHQRSQALSGLLWELRQVVDRNTVNSAAIAAWTTFHPGDDFVLLLVNELSACTLPSKYSAAISVIRRRDRRRSGISRAESLDRTANEQN